MNIFWLVLAVQQLKAGVVIRPLPQPVLASINPTVPLLHEVLQKDCESTDDCCEILYPRWKKEIEESPHHVVKSASAAVAIGSTLSAVLDELDLSLQSAFAEHVVLKDGDDDPSRASFFCTDLRTDKGWETHGAEEPPHEVGPWVLHCDEGYSIVRFLTYIVSLERRSQGLPSRKGMIKAECVKDGSPPKNLPNRYLIDIPDDPDRQWGWGEDMGTLYALGGHAVIAIAVFLRSADKFGLMPNRMNGIYLP